VAALELSADLPHQRNGLNFPCLNLKNIQLFQPAARLPKQHNRIGCRGDLSPPSVRGDDLIEQPLPINECGQPSACDIQTFIQNRRSETQAVAAALLALSKKDKETTRRMEGLQTLLQLFQII